MTDSAELGTAREAAGVRSTAFYGDGKIPVPTASYSPPSAGGRSSPCRDRLPSCPARRRRGRSLPASRNRRGAGGSRRRRSLAPASSTTASSSICHTVMGQTVYPRPASSPWMRRYSSRGCPAPSRAPAPTWTRRSGDVRDRSAGWSLPGSWPTSPTTSTSTPSRRHRTYPRVVKRACRNSCRVKRPGDYGTRHPGPATSVNGRRFTRPTRNIINRNDQLRLSGIGP
jgi:hypothetical protein